VLSICWRVSSPSQVEYLRENFIHNAKAVPLPMDSELCRPSRLWSIWSASLAGCDISAIGLSDARFMIAFIRNGCGRKPHLEFGSADCSVHLPDFGNRQQETTDKSPLNKACGCNEKLTIVNSKSSPPQISA